MGESSKVYLQEHTSYKNTEKNIAKFKEIKRKFVEKSLSSKEVLLLVVKKAKSDILKEHKIIEQRRIEREGEIARILEVNPKKLKEMKKNTEMVLQAVDSGSAVNVLSTVTTINKATYEQQKQAQLSISSLVKSIGQMEKWKKQASS